MATFSMGFHYNEGKRVGYEISFPNSVGGMIVLNNVSGKDKARIVREIRNLGIDRKDIEIDKE